MLIAGCMLSSDVNYDELAEVHVPAYCAEPADFMVGCLLPMANNYDPLAKQSGKCAFNVKGCMSSSAYNYNPDATISNDNCLYEGCTYEGAWNYDETANSDDGSVEYSTGA